jgi:prolyl-tRNA editing enzyme YbaK/EbsC (Cys-tRNA(Pro) deacylase)
MEWPEPVERVGRLLQEARAESRIEEFADGTPTAEAAAEAIGCELAQIVKSLLFDCDGRFVLALVPGDRRADPGAVARLAEASSARVATSEQVEKATGFAPGGVAPFPLLHVESVLADRSLLGQEIVWIGAGTPRHMAALTPSDLIRVARARTVDLVAHG